MVDDPGEEVENDVRHEETIREAVHQAPLKGELLTKEGNIDRQDD